MHNLMKAQLLLVLILVCGGLSLPARAEVRETLSYNYYNVFLPSHGFWGSAVNASTPIHGDNGEPLGGYTSTDITWNFGTEYSADNFCHLTWIQVTLTAVVTLPDLKTDEYDQLTHFNKYLDALRFHEMGHLEIGRKAARTIDSQATAMPPMANCDELTQAVNSMGNNALDQEAAENQQHDNPEEYDRVRNAGN